MTLAELRRDFAAAWKLTGGHRRIAAVIGVAALAVGAVFFSPGNPFPSLVIALGAFVVMLVLLARYQGALHRRIADECGSEWIAFINDIEAGAISDSEYASLRARVYFDHRNYLAQLGNAVRSIASILVIALTVVPAMLFWMVVLVADYDPATVKAVFEVVAFFDPTTGHAVRKILGALVIGVSMAVIVAGGLFGGGCLGLRNVFEDGVREKVRRRLGCRTEGRLVLMRVSEGRAVYLDEMACVRPANTQQAHSQG